jgi:hypothetical protein
LLLRTRVKALQLQGPLGKGFAKTSDANCF